MMSYYHSISGTYPSNHPPFSHSASRREEHINIAYKRKTGQYYASMGLGHVWNGKSLDDLAQQMAMAKDPNFRVDSFRPGNVYVRTGRGKSKIKGTIPAPDHEITDGTFLRILTDRKRLVEVQRNETRDKTERFMRKQLDERLPKTTSGI